MYVCIIGEQLDFEISSLCDFYIIKMYGVAGFIFRKEGTSSLTIISRSHLGRHLEKLRRQL